MVQMAENDDETDGIVLEVFLKNRSRWMFWW